MRKYKTTKLIQLLAPMGAVMATTTPLMVSCSKKCEIIDKTVDEFIKVTPTKFELHEEIQIPYEILDNRMGINIDRSYVSIGGVSWSIRDSQCQLTDTHLIIPAEFVTEPEIIIKLESYNKYLISVRVFEASKLEFTPCYYPSFELVPNLEIQLNGGKWTKLNEHTTVELPQYSVLSIRGDNPDGFSGVYDDDIYTKLTFLGGKVLLEGSIMGLLDQGAAKITDIPNACCFEYLFRNSTAEMIVNKDFLPATKMTAKCYQEMFYGCEHLLSAPVLNITELAQECFADMFYGCDALTSAEFHFPTTFAVACCWGMFSGCDQLRTVSPITIETLAGNCCQGMFQTCKALNITEDDGTTQILDLTNFTSQDEINASLGNMFSDTGGLFKSTPTATHKYYSN